VDVMASLSQSCLGPDHSLSRKGNRSYVEIAGKEAIEKCKIGFYNLVLIDIRLPDMDGTDLLTATLETTPRMIKIMITGHPTTETRTEATRRNADGYLVKPIKIDELLRTITNHLDKQESTPRDASIAV